MKFFNSKKLTLKTLTVSMLSLATLAQTVHAEDQILPVKKVSSIKDLEGVKIQQTKYVEENNRDDILKNDLLGQEKPFINSQKSMQSHQTDLVTPSTIQSDSLTNSDNQADNYQADEQKIIQPETIDPIRPAQSMHSNNTINYKSVNQPQENVDMIEETTEETANDGQGIEVRDNDTSNDDVIKKIQNKGGKIYKTLNLTNYAKAVNASEWTPQMQKNSAMTVKLQALLDWNHASPGPIDGGWGMNSIKALTNFQAMKGLPKTGKMDQDTWNALIQGVDSDQPVLMSYTITKNDNAYKYTQLPGGYEAKSKLKALNYQSIYEKIAEEYHMNVNYLKKLNKGKKFTVGESITVYNPGPALQANITKVVANKADKTLYAYHGRKLVATYPTTVGSAATPSPHGTFKIANRVKKPYYKATVGEGKDKKIYMLKPGPNSPVGIVWMGLSKPTYGLHGSPLPEGISRQASHGCIRLTNWDVLEVYANIKKGATVVLE